MMQTHHTCELQLVLLSMFLAWRLQVLCCNMHRLQEGVHAGIYTCRNVYMQEGIHVGAACQDVLHKGIPCLELDCTLLACSINLA